MHKKTALFLYGKIECTQEMIVKSAILELNDLIEDLLIISPYKSNKLDRILGIADANIVRYDVGTLTGWREIYKYNRIFLEENEIANIIIFKVIMAKNCKNENMSLIETFKKKRISNDTFSFNFNQTKTILARFSLVESASKICRNVYHLVIDPQEPSFEDVCKFNNFEKLYITNKEGFQYIPFYEAGIRNEICDIQYNKNKKVDFVFYCSALTEDRNDIAQAKEYLESIKNWDVKINTKKVKPIKQNEYYKKLKEARYTLCIKPYDKSAFSMIRFVESICSDCLCFIYEDVCLDDVKHTFYDLYIIMKKYLIVNSFDDIKEKIESISEEKRLSIIKKIKATESWNRMMDMQEAKKEWNLLEGIRCKK